MAISDQAKEELEKKKKKVFKIMKAIQFVTSL